MKTDNFRQRIKNEVSDIMNANSLVPQNDWDLICVLSGYENDFDNGSGKKRSENRDRLTTAIELSGQVAITRKDNFFPPVLYIGTDIQNNNLRDVADSFLKQYDFQKQKLIIPKNLGVRNTEDQIKKISNYFSGKERKIVVISDAYHLPRVKRYLKGFPGRFNMEKIILYPATPKKVPIKKVLEEAKKIQKYIESGILAPEDYFWVIGGGLLQIPLIAEVRKNNLRVIVSDLSADCACRDLADIFVKADIFDIEGHVREAKKLVKNGIKIVGVLAAGIDAPETMAQLAKELGLPSVDPEIARLVHNKAVFRERLKKLGYPMPKFAKVSQENLDQLEKIIDNIGFPLIVKNTDSSGSRGTKIFRQKDIGKIKEMVLIAIEVSKSKTALIEECWEGPEQTVETIFDIDGKFHTCFITDRIFDRSSGYAIETGLRQPSSLSKKVQKEMYKIVENVAKDLKIKIGAAKCDMILTVHGPRIIEMTTRLSGGFDSQYLVPAATGKNVMGAAIFTALGKKFPKKFLEDTKHRVGITESVWPIPGKIIKIEGVKEAKEISGVEHIFFRYKEGDVVLPYTDCTKRVCFIIVTGKNGKEARFIMEKAKKIIKVVTEKI